METIITKRTFLTKSEEEAFKLGYDASLPNVKALAMEVNRQAAIIQQLRASGNKHFAAHNKRQQRD